MDLPSREDVVPDLDKPPKLYADPSELLEYRFWGAWRAMVTARPYGRRLICASSFFMKTD